jgi:hypothetical protein
MDCSKKNIVLKKMKKVSHKRKIQDSATLSFEQKKQKLNEDYNNNIGDADQIKLTPINNVESNLLLAYTYFLDALMTAHITVGFESESFEPVILIRQSGSHGSYGQIKFTPEEWSVFCTHIQEKDKYSVNIKKIIIVRKCDSLIQLKQRKVVILTNVTSYNTMINLLPHINYILKHYIECKKMNLISDYYKLVISETLEKEVDILKLNEFVKESYFSKFFNYKRLFNELLIFCESKIKNEIIFEKMVNDIKE